MLMFAVGLGWVGSGVPTSVVGWVSKLMGWDGLQKMDPRLCLDWKPHDPI